MKNRGRGLSAVLLAVGAIIAALLLVSGNDRADPRTPSGLRGLPPPFLGTTVLGNGGLTAAVDAYGNVVDLRAPGPAGRALIDNPIERQTAGTVATGTGIQLWVRIDGGPPLPMWRADMVRQRYLPGTNVLRTAAWFGESRVEVRHAAHAEELAVVVDGDATVQLRTSEGGDFVTRDPRVLAEAAASDRGWLERAHPLAPGAPPWAERMYERSLLVLRALTDRRTGAIAAGARDGWAYVWPRDAGTAALAFAAAGYRAEARLVARFLLRLDLDAAARFYGDGSPVPGRGPQGDAAGWSRVAAGAVGLPVAPEESDWRDLPDYQEKDPGDYLGNALASIDGPKRALDEAQSARRLVRRLDDPASGLDSAAAWAVRPFSRPELYPAARQTLIQLTADRGRFGITPSADWPDEDPWSAPTAWVAWSLAALGDRQRALALMRALRRAATPAGAIPERVDVRTGVPRSTTPLAWSHAFAVLALRELWPRR